MFPDGQNFYLIFTCRWEVLVTKLQDKVKVSEETLYDWEQYQIQAQQLQVLLQAATQQLQAVEVKDLPLNELQNQLTSTQQVVQDSQQGQAQLAELQKTAQSVLIRLPPSEAKAAIQKELLHILDQCEE